MGSVENVATESFPRFREKPNTPRSTQRQRPGRDIACKGLFAGAIASLLYVGWINRDEQIWVPDYGVGYGLGVVGGSLMLLLLLYPIQKHFLILSKWLKVRYFFRLHMVFGILGPVLIILHSNYRLGSINGRVALFSMLVVMFSGLVGRYIYQKIHHGLYGRRARFDDFRIESREISTDLGSVLDKGSVKQKLVQLEHQIDAAPDDFLASALFWTRIRFMTVKSYRLFERQLIRQLGTESTDYGWDRARRKSKEREVRYLLRTHKKALIKMLEIRFYERMFSLWHVLHFPLFIMMVVTGLAHVYAVHVY